MIFFRIYEANAFHIKCCNASYFTEKPVLSLSVLKVSGPRLAHRLLYVLKLCAVDDCDNNILVLHISLQ